MAFAYILYGQERRGGQTPVLFSIGQLSVFRDRGSQSSLVNVPANVGGAWLVCHS